MTAADLIAGIQAAISAGLLTAYAILAEPVVRQALTTPPRVSTPSALEEAVRREAGARGEIAA